MRFFTTHLREGRPPVLVREGFSGAAFWFGAFWLAASGAWIAAGITMAAALLVFVLAQATGAGVLLLAFATLQGLLCPDFLRWNLAKRGYQPGPVVAARDPDLALQRLLDHRPDLLPLFDGRRGVAA